MEIFKSKVEAYIYIMDLIQNNRSFNFDVSLVYCPECQEEYFQYRIILK